MGSNVGRIRNQEAGLCRCGEKPVEGRRLCSRCAEKMRNYSREKRRSGWKNKYANEARRRKREAGLCECGATPRPGKKSCAVCAEKAKLYTRKTRQNPEVMKKTLAWNRISYKRLKDNLFEAYGGRKCACCGETRSEFLTIDHLVPAGARHHKTRCGVGLYRWLKKQGYPSGYRVLCMNCNFAIGHFGRCPHEAER